MNFAIETLRLQFAAVAGSIPLFALQAAALLGMLGAALVLTRQSGRPIYGREIYLGVALGVVAYTISWFVSDFMRGAVKPNLSIDILILAGLLGGWRGGLACLTIMIGARLQFGGTANIVPALIDNGTQLLMGCLLRRYLHPGLLQVFSGRTVLIVWGGRILATYAGLVLAAAVADMSGEALGRLAVMRTVMLPLSLFILYSALLMVYVDAQIDRHHERERQLYDKHRHGALALAESEARFRSLFDNSPAALSFADPQGRILGNNARFVQLFGYRREDMPTLADWFRLAYPDPDYRREVLARWDAELRQAMHEQRDITPGKYRVSCKDGRVRTVVIDAAVIGSDILTSFRDVTEQEAAEAGLRESEERLRNLFERVENISVQAYDEDRRVIYWNKASEVLYGYSAEEAFGRRLEDLIIPPAMKSHVVAGVCNWLQAGVPIPAGELELLRKDGATIAVFSSHVMMQTRHGREMYCVDIDLTEIRQAHERLKLAASVFTHSREGIVITSPQGRIIDLNARFCEICGYEREALIGRKGEDVLLSELHGPAFYTALRQDLADRGQWSGEIWNRRENGDLYASMLSVNAVRDTDGTVTHYVALASDVTSQRTQEKQLAHAANYDALTSLPNRKLLSEQLNEAIRKAARSGRGLAVVYLDLDSFKQVNDRYGQDIGNQLLMLVAQRVRGALREADLLARLGGDEFVAVLENQASAAACSALLEDMLTAVSVPVTVENHCLEVSASLGVTFYPQGLDVDADLLLRQADQAMYQAKLAGKNRYALFDAAHDRDLRGNFETREAVRLALQLGQFVLYYQPKVNLRSGEVIGCEALIRWQHPERGLLPPSAFLPVVEGSDLAVEIDEWVIDTALAQLAAWSADGLELGVSVNVGARQLLQPGFEQRLAVRLRAHPGVRPEQLEVEVLESSALADLARAGQVIKVCRELGVGFAIDDFGTGYSSLTYLKHLPVGVLKIDQSFVREMLCDRDSIAILEGIIDLASAFDRKVIAEGVETSEHAAMLLRLGCVHAQGYGIARPMPAGALPAWIASWRPEAEWADIRRVRREELPILHVIVEYRAWLTELEDHLLRSSALGPPPVMAWACLPADQRQTAARETQHQLHLLVGELLSLKAANRSQGALARLAELVALRDRLADEMLGMLHRAADERRCDVLAA